MGPHNYIFNLMPIYIFVWLMMGPHIVRGAIYNSTLTLVCGVGERERERVGVGELMKTRCLITVNGTTRVCYLLRTRVIFYN